MTVVKKVNLLFIQMQAIYLVGQTDKFDVNSISKNSEGYILEGKILVIIQILRIRIRISLRILQIRSEGSMSEVDFKYSDKWH